MSRSRLQVFGALAAAVAGILVAVASGLAAGTATSGVAAASAVRLQTVHHTVRIGGVAVRVTSKATGAVCYSATSVTRCAPSLGDDQLSYGTGHAGARVVLVGVAGPGVKAVIAHLTKRGTVWPQLRSGAFYAVLPKGYKLRSIVKVLGDGRRVSFSAAS